MATKPVTPQDMFDMWQKMVNPGAYPLQSLMFPVLDPKELEKKIGELEVVEHWMKANLTMLQMSIKSLQYQRAMLKGGEKFRDTIGRKPEEEAPAPEAPLDNPAMWAWNMMADVGKNAAKAVQATPKKRKRPTSRKG